MRALTGLPGDARHWLSWSRRLVLVCHSAFLSDPFASIGDNTSVVAVIEGTDLQVHNPSDASFCQFHGILCF